MLFAQVFTRFLAILCSCCYLAQAEVISAVPNAFLKFSEVEKILKAQSSSELAKAYIYQAVLPTDLVPVIRDANKTTVLFEKWIDYGSW